MQLLGKDSELQCPVICIKELLSTPGVYRQDQTLWFRDNMKCYFYTRSQLVAWVSGKYSRLESEGYSQFHFLSDSEQVLPSVIHLSSCPQHLTFIIIFIIVIVIVIVFIITMTY